MSNPSAYTFWLKERQVTGVIIAEHGEEKLVEYAQRFYVVKGKDPGKRHYTQSTIPVLWKKVMNGQLRIDADMKALGITKKMVREAVANRESVRKQVKAAQLENVHLHPAPKEKKRGETIPPAAGSAPKGAATAPAPARKSRAAKAEAAKIGHSVEAKRQKRNPAPSPTPPPDSSSLIWLECPYCKELDLISAFDQEIGKAQIRLCRKCRREFGVRIVPTAFRAEIAAFPGGK